MGSPNFAATWNGIGGSFGLVPEYPSDEAVESARVDFEWGEDWTDDEVRDQLYQDYIDANSEDYERVAEDLSYRIETVVDRLWQFGDKGGYSVEFPYELVMNLGYHNGWCARIESTVSPAHLNDDTYWLTYCDLSGRMHNDPERYSLHYSDAPQISYQDFAAHLDKVCDAVVWVFETYCEGMGLPYVSGGWTGGSSKMATKDWTPIAWREKWEEMFPAFKMVV